MKLNQLYESLSYGELSNLAIAEDTPGTIKDKAKPKIIQYTNDALLSLYSRFLLKEKQVMLLLYRHITNYHFEPRFAVQYDTPDDEVDQPYRYILDLPNEPFLGDVIKVLVVYDEYGNRLPLNDEARSWSVFTPQAAMLQVPRPIEGNALAVTYQARHPLLLKDDEDQKVEVPAILETALKAFVAYKVFSHMNTAESSAKAQEFMASYENECMRVEEKDLVNSSITTSNVRFRNNGWI
jgi:hypothetical protein